MGATALAVWLALYPLLGKRARNIALFIGAAWTLMALAVVGSLWHTPLDDMGSILRSVGIVTRGGAVFEQLRLWPSSTAPGWRRPGWRPRSAPKGDGFDNALAESINASYKAQCAQRLGPWRDASELEIAPAEWVEFYNKQRLHGSLERKTPAEYEAAYWTRLAAEE